MQYRQLLLKRILQGGINIILMDQVSEKTPVSEVISFSLTGIFSGTTSSVCVWGCGRSKLEIYEIYD